MKLGRITPSTSNYKSTQISTSNAHTLNRLWHLLAFLFIRKKKRRSQGTTILNHKNPACVYLWQTATKAFTIFISNHWYLLPTEVVLHYSEAIQWTNSKVFQNILSLSCSKMPQLSFLYASAQNCHQVDRQTPIW